jgi:hypothetical protein
MWWTLSFGAITKSTRWDGSNDITLGAAGELQASNGLGRIAEPVKPHRYNALWVKRPTRFRGMRPRDKVTERLGQTALKAMCTENGRIFRGSDKKSSLFHEQ